MSIIDAAGWSGRAVTVEGLGTQDSASVILEFTNPDRQHYLQASLEIVLYGDIVRHGWRLDGTFEPFDTDVDPNYEAAIASGVPTEELTRRFWCESLYRTFDVILDDKHIYSTQPEEIPDLSIELSHHGPRAELDIDKAVAEILAAFEAEHLEDILRMNDLDEITASTLAAHGLALLSRNNDRLAHEN